MGNSDAVNPSREPRTVSACGNSSTVPRVATDFPAVPATSGTFTCQWEGFIVTAHPLTKRDVVVTATGLRRQHNRAGLSEFSVSDGVAGGIPRLQGHDRSVPDVARSPARTICNRVTPWWRCADEAQSTGTAFDQHRPVPACAGWRMRSARMSRRKPPRPEPGSRRQRSDRNNGTPRLYDL